MRFFNIKKFSLRLAHKCQKAKFEKGLREALQNFISFQKLFTKNVFFVIEEKNALELEVPGSYFLGKTIETSEKHHFTK